MRMSCNGCRVLRKGCTNNCVLKPCLQWLKSPQSQANATLFLAKFYGRVGLLNLLNAGPHHLRPAIFKSLLYEACGRIVQPVHGCAGLLISGEWDRCQAAVDAVLEGSPIADHITPHAPASHPVNPPLKTPFDSSSNPATPDDVILCNLALRKRCKRSPEPPTAASQFRYSYSSRTEGLNGEFNSGSSSHFSSPSDQVGEVGLELTLGRGSMPRASRSSVPADLTNVREGGSGGYAYKTEEFMF